MNVYNVIRLTTGRVILDNRDPNTKEGERVLQSIKAKSWLRAREKVNTLMLYHDPGNGWFEI